MKAVHGPNRCARHVQKDARKKDRCKKTTRDTRPIMLKWLRLTWLVCSHKLVFSVFSSPFSFFLLPRFHLLYVLDCRPDDSCSPASISFNLSPNIALCARRVGHLFSFVSQYSFVCSMPWPMISQSTSMSFLLSFCIAPNRFSCEGFLFQKERPDSCASISFHLSPSIPLCARWLSPFWSILCELDVLAGWLLQLYRHFFWFVSQFFSVYVLDALSG